MKISSTSEQDKDSNTTADDEVQVGNTEDEDKGGLQRAIQRAIIVMIETFLMMEIPI